MSTSPKIALFLGADIVAHMIMNKLVPYLVGEGYEPILFFPEHPASSRANQVEVMENAFYERHLLNNTVYPFLEENPYHNQANLTPTQMAERYDLRIEKVKNVNDPEFVNGLAGLDNLRGALSIRCFQIFKPEIIGVLNNMGSESEPSFFYNLHPGLLPQYRGVLSTARAMAATAMKTNGQSFGCTLHVIDAGIDTGDILWPKARLFDMNKTVFATNIDLASLGFQAIQQVFTEIKNGNSIVPIPQETVAAPKNYYTYPTAEELAQWRALGIRLYDRAEVTQFMIEAYSKPGSPHAAKLEAAINARINKDLTQKTGKHQHMAGGNVKSGNASETKDTLRDKINHLIGGVNRAQRMPKADKPGTPLKGPLKSGSLPLSALKS